MADAAAEDHLGEMRESGVRGLLVYCADYRCSHLKTMAPADVDR
jgi:hypothetical protein